MCVRVGRGGGWGVKHLFVYLRLKCQINVCDFLFPKRGFWMCLPWQPSASAPPDFALDLS